MISRATRVIIQLIESIITSTPITVTTEVMIWVRLWFKRLADGVHIVGDARKHFTVVGAVKIPQRHAVDLLRRYPCGSGR